jgi:hypothetical protein
VAPANARERISPIAGITVHVTRHGELVATSWLRNARIVQTPTSVDLYGDPTDFVGVTVPIDGVFALLPIGNPDVGVAYLRVPCPLRQKPRRPRGGGTLTISWEGGLVARLVGAERADDAVLDST